MPCSFDDLKRSETDILQSISEYLAKSYYENAFLNGIIYLQRIQETRIQGSGLRCLSIFEKIVGMENMRNVLLVTNMWDTLPQPPSGRLPGESITAHEVGERKERELRETPEFWGRFLHAGAHYSRHLGTYKSAEQVVSHFLPSSSSDIGKPMTLLLQDELIHGRCRLEETTVGKYINDELYKQQKQYEKEVRDPKRKKELLDDVKAKGEILAMTVEDIVIPEEMGRRTCTVM